MDAKRKNLKRITALLFSVLVFMMVLFVSYISVFAEDVTGKCAIHWYGSGSGSAYIAYSVDGVSYSDIYNFSGSSQLNNQSITFSLPGYYRFYASTYYNGDRYRIQYVKVNNSITYSYSHDFPVYESIIDPGFTVLMYCYRYTSSSEITNYDQYIYIHFTSSSTPSPEPTSTPDPTPTPGIDPGPPLPTISPGDQSYQGFFSRLAGDAQNAFNAIFASWQSANNGFYTSIFFIGIPVFIGIFGLVAYIVFGGDDE